MWTEEKECVHEGLTIRENDSCLYHEPNNPEERFRQVEDRYEHCERCGWEDWLPGAKPPRMFCPKCKKLTRDDVRDEIKYFKEFTYVKLPYRPIRRRW